MKNKALELNMGGLRCDNPDCDYINNDVLVSDYENWLNKPCPKCSQILLTEEDYNTVKSLLSIVCSLNKVLPYDENEERITTSIEMNGTGNIEFNMEDK